MNSNKKTVVIGLGSIGKHHVRILFEKSNLVAVADTNQIVASEISKKYKVSSFNNYQKMLDQKDVDAAVVAVPTQLHYKIAAECLKRNIPTLVEKPIAHNLEAAKDLLRIARRHKTFLMVGHVERFNPVVIKLKEIIERGRLGKMISLLALRVGINPPLTSGSDVALDLAIHDIDIFNFLLNQNPVKITVQKERLYKRNVSDSAIVLLKYKHTTATIQTNWVTPIKMRQLYATGSLGFAEIDYIQQKLVLYEKQPRQRSDTSFHDIISLSEGPKKEIFVSKKEPLKQELMFFLENIQNYKLTESAVSAIKALEMIT